MKSNIIFLLATVALLLVSPDFSKATTSTTSYNIETSKTADPEEMAKKLTEQMRIKLDLSAKQTVEVGAINLKYAKKMAVLKDQERSMSKIRAFKSLNNDKNAEMKKILSKAQYKDYEKIMKEVQQNRKRGRK